MISDTLNLRRKYGQFRRIDADQCKGFEHVSCCQACGSSKPERLFGVSADGCTLLVGSRCANVLTSAKLQRVDDALRGSGETYTDGNKAVVYITEDWLRKLGEYTYPEAGRKSNSQFAFGVIGNFENSYTGSAYVSEFLHSIFTQARQNGKISQKQFEAANRLMGV